MSKIGVIKNRSAAPIQITAEQLLREAKERGLDDVAPPPTQFITDREELQLYQQSKRKDFEDQIRRQRQHIGTWCRYALWEAAQKEFERSRSVFERALDVDYRNQTLWLKYADMEMKNKFINHARNIWDRAVTLHPRVDTFWFKYSYMEELVGAVDNCRQVFERWMQWEPDDVAWASFIKFEMRQGQLGRARALYERYVALLPTARAYLKYAKWEEAQHQRGLARTVYERSLSELHPLERNEKLLTNFARFEERCKEFDRARVVYQFAIEQATALEKTDDVLELKKEFVAFEKRHGDKGLIEDAIIKQRREVYEEKVAKDRYDYDAWFDYLRLEESEREEAEEGKDASWSDGSRDNDRVRLLYERAVAIVPPVAQKKYWKRYIYLWINYAVYAELVQRDVDYARALYRRCLDAIPHKLFTFGKIWLLAAQLEVRVKDLAAARKLLGTALGLTKKVNVFKGYIELELQLGEIDRCRSIYKKFIEATPFAFTVWRDFAQLEINVGEVQRARAIYELATNVDELDSPELLWKAYIDFEIAEREIDNVRQLFERLLQKSSHVKVWIAFANFEAENATLAGGGGGEEEDEKGAEATSRKRARVEESSIDENEPDSARSKKAAGFAKARQVFERGYTMMKEEGLKEERLMLLESWRDVESLANGQGVGSIERISAIESKFPKKVRVRREAGEAGESDYFYDYIFPDDEKKVEGMKLLEKAMQWKRMSETFGGGVLSLSKDETSLSL